jgi:hypothetical protein
MRPFLASIAALVVSSGATLRGEDQVMALWG